MIFWIGKKAEEQSNMTGEERIIRNIVVLIPLKQIVGCLSRNKIMLYEEEKRMTIDAFKILHKNNEPYDVAEIRSWLIIKAKLKPDLADEFVDIAQRISNGKIVTCRYTSDAWRSDAISDWRKQANDPSYNSEEIKSLH